jgi:hypothetical protein
VRSSMSIQQNKPIGHRVAYPSERLAVMIQGKSPVR